MGGWPWPLSAVQGWFESLYNTIGGIVNSVVSQIVSGIGSFGNFLKTLILTELSSLYQNLAGGLNWVFRAVQGELSSLATYLAGGYAWIVTTLRGELNSIADRLTGGLGWLWGQVNSGLTTITNSVQGALGTVGSSIVEGLKGLADFILGGLTLFWNFLTNTVVPTITSALAAAFQFLKDLFTNTFRTLMQILGIGAPLEPENALIHAIEVAIPAFLVNFGIFLAATGSDLLHPLKGTGVVPSAIEIVRSLGPEIVSGAIVGSYAFAVVEAPLKLYWHSLARPTRPRGPLTDRMFFHGAIDMPTVRKMMAYEGFPDWAIDAWVRSWWQEPSDRLIIALVDDPSIPPGWIRTKLQDRGYSAVDIEVLVNYAQNKALGKVKGSREGTVITRYSQGYISDDEFTQELLALGYRPELISKARAAAVLGRDTDERKELVKVWTEQFRKDLLTVDEFRSNLETVLVSTRLIESIIELERARRFPTPKRPAGV